MGSLLFVPTSLITLYKLPIFAEICLVQIYTMSYLLAYEVAFLHSFGTKKMTKIKTNIPGLKLRSGSYQLRKMVAGIHIQKNLGRVDEIDLRAAETRALELINSVKEQGHFALDNFDRRKRAGMAPTGSNENNTLGDVAREMIQTGKTNGTRKTGNKPWKKSTVKAWEEWLGSSRIAPLVNERLASVTSQNIVDWYVVDLRENKPAATDNSFRKLRRVVAWALGDGMISEDVTLQMANNQRRITVPKRDTRLEINRGEPGKFALALSDYSGKYQMHTSETIKHIVLLSLITGRRTNELKKMEWKWVDLERGRITIPGEVIAENDLSDFEGTKNRKNEIIPMARIVRTMMHHRKEQSEAIKKRAIKDNDHRKAKAAARFVFLGRDNRKPIANFRNALADILTLAGLGGIVPHDLRRTFSDIVSIEGYDFYSTQLAMGHTVNSVTAQYLGDMSIQKKTKLFQDVSNWLSQAMPLEGLTVDGEPFSFSGMDEMEEDSETKKDGHGWNKDALEILMFPERIWRTGWTEHNGFEDAVDIHGLINQP